jgi:hypothetical protein
MAALSRRLTAPGVRAFMWTPLGPNVSAALFPELTSETSAAQWEQGHGPMSPLAYAHSVNKAHASTAPATPRMI